MQNAEWGAGILLAFMGVICYNKLSSNMDFDLRRPAGDLEGGPLLNRKLTQLLQGNLRVYFIVLIVFTAMTACYSIPVAAGQLVVVIALALYNREYGRRRRREISKYLDNISGSTDIATKDTMTNAPLPMLMFRPESGEIVWANSRFLNLVQDARGEEIYDRKLPHVVPGFETHWIIEGKSAHPGEVRYNGRRYQVFGQLARTGGRTGGFVATTYWMDVTDLSEVRDRFTATRPVAALLLIDNYEDLMMKNLTDNERSNLLAEIDARLDAWVAGTGVLLRRFQRERYLLIFEEQYLEKFIEKKFDVLDAVREVVNPSGINASLSIGIGKDGDSFQELLNFANLSIDMALSRGGDQVVIRNKYTFEFYGGRTKETEKRTKVKSRVMANALSSLISDSSRVFIMGHRAPDNDCIGAAAGVFALCRKNGVPAHIIRTSGPNPSQELCDRLQRLPEYQDGFLTSQDAMVIADSRSLAVVVDTNRPEQVQAPELLQSCNRVAVIDHHRRAATYIEGAALNYHEPYASSASELVTELLQYIMEPNQVLRTEAEALLAGIVLDTKNFTMRTGGRTFEAAAFLRRSGADTAEVKKLYQNNFGDAVSKYSLIQSARLYREHIAIAHSEIPVSRVTAAQAADELLNIIGIDTSFVLAGDGERVNISGRSMGDTNVQVILEKLGGGGNAAVAGGQIEGKSVDEVLEELKAAIDGYLEK